MNTIKIAEAMIDADKTIARLALREITTDEAEDIAGIRLDGRRAYATDGKALYCLVRQNSRSVHWQGEWILWKKSKSEHRRSVVLNYIKVSKRSTHTKNSIVSALKMTKHQVIHAVDTLILDNKIHAANVVKQGGGHGTVYYKFGPKKCRKASAVSVINGPW